MVIVRRTLDDIRAHPGRIDHARIAATTEDDIRRHMIEDGEDPDAPLPATPVVLVLPQVLRERLGMTQAEFAAAIQVPVATLRNWEQGRRQLDPAARSLLRVIAANPVRALRALGWRGRKRA